MTAICIGPECDRPAKVKKLCQAHYLQQWSGHDLKPLRKTGDGICKGPECGKKARGGRGLCSGHYGQYYYGKELTVIQRVRETTHGRESTYTNRKCRCGLCVTAYNAYQRGLSARRREALVVTGIEHGTREARAQGCRCPECKKQGVNVSWYKRKDLLSSEQYLKMMDDQAGLCALCKERPATTIDRVPGTKTVRGIVCTPCNMGLGKLGDDEAGLLRALAYIRSRTPADLD